MRIPTSQKEISWTQNKLHLPPNSGYMTLVKQIRIYIINHKIIQQHSASTLGNYNIIMKKHASRLLKYVTQVFMLA
jgi:hypothetical protein